MSVGISWLDIKLGARMLLKYPGLAVVGGIGMAVAIAIGSGAFAFFHSHLYPHIPLPEGNRIVALENWNTRRNNEERQSLHDYAAWRRDMRTVRDVAAFRTVGRNLITGGGAAQPIAIAEMTASGFRVARVAPRMGRYLVDDDERPGALPVLVLGHGAWTTRFAGDPGIVGRTVRVGNTVHTIVGVMPEGFAFPLNHEYWTPLRTDTTRYQRGAGPEIFVFGRLAPGVSMERAQAELSAIGRGASAAFPKTHQHLRARVLPYTYPLMDIQDVGLASVSLMQLLVSLLLVVVAVNVAILVYARTATRQGEIAVRSALGASRRRIVAQLFAEALVLSVSAAAVGLVLAQYGLRQANAIMEQDTSGAPFWVSYGLSPWTVLYAVAMAVLAAVIVGVLPALQATGSRLQSSLRQMGGGTGMRLGRTWTVLIVVQVALAVAALPAAFGTGWSQMRHATTVPSFAADEFLGTWITMDRDVPEGVEATAWSREFPARFAGRMDELVRRLRAAPGVASVAVAGNEPGGEAGSWVQVEGIPAPAETPAGHPVQFTRVAADYFDALGVALAAGRPFAAADADSMAPAVIVNRAFVHKVLGGGNAVGRRVRYAPQADDDGDEQAAGPARWYEIVGVVDDLEANAMEPGLVDAAVYHAAAPAEMYPAFLAVRVRGTDAGAFATPLREIATAVDPTLKLPQPRTLDDLDRQGSQAVRLLSMVIGLITVSVLLLSAAGIYALMSFTVTRRRREIGIRAALGAEPGRLLRGIFSRAVGQLGLGLAVGIAGVVLLEIVSGGGMMFGKGPILLPAVALVMTVVGILAAVGPARRGLRIQPMDALREE